MLDYLVMGWPAASASADDQRIRASAVLTTLGLVKTRAATGYEIWLRADRPPSLKMVAGGAWVIIGDIFGDDAFPSLRESTDPLAVAKALCAEHWGAYVAVSLDEPAPSAIFRDPSGALDCVTWRRDELTLAASDFSPPLRALAPLDLSIDWARLGDMLRSPGLASDRLALKGVQAVGPGCVKIAEKETRIWRPSAFTAKARQPRSVQQGALGDTLRETIDGVVEAWTRRYPQVLAEVSGGLDSAMIASCLVRSKADVQAWLNFHPPEAQADERRFARQVAQLNGLDVTFIDKPSITYSLEALASGSQSARPGLNRVDHDYDDAVAARAESLGAQAIMGGQGGDAVLYRQPDPLIVADAVAALGWRALTPARLEPMAWWTQTSVWTLGRLALRDRLGATPKPRLLAPSFLAQDFGNGVRELRHPWVIDAAQAPPARQMQILGLANCLAFQGPCARKQAAALIHPLLSQPVVELCLSMSTIDLSLGRGDRGLARLAFRDRLPAAIVNRRTKGELGTFYGYGVCDSLDVLRPLLLEGLLVEHGLLARDKLDLLLDPDALISSSEIMSVIVAALLEAWARSWTAALLSLRGAPAQSPSVGGLSLASEP